MQNNKKTDVNPINTEPTSILPDFCDNQVLLLVVLAAELLAIVLTLSHDGKGIALFNYLGYCSLFIQSVALTDAALLCFLQKRMRRLDPKLMAILIYIALQLVTLTISAISIYIVKTTTLNLLFTEEWYRAVIIRNLSISAIITAVLMRYFYIRHQWQQQILSETKMRIQALQARIRPHFLFNSLNTIANLVHEHPGKAETAVLDLADMFRTTLADLNIISLIDEINITERYLRLEALRLGERLKIEWHIEENCKSIPLPALTLQPLAENAVYHGIEPLPNGGTIGIHAAINNRHFLIIRISNPKIDPQTDSQYNTNKLPQTNELTSSKPGNQIALNNIRQRLGLTYQGKASLTIENLAKEYSVIIKIPTTIPNLS